MKKIFCILLTLIFFCGCATTNSANSINSANTNSNNSANETIDMSLDSFGGEGSGDVIEFINDPRDYQLYPDMHIIFRFEKQNGQLLLTGISSGFDKQGPFLALNDSDNIWKKFNSSEYCQRAIAFLCDEDAIKQCFRENGVENIQNIIILNLDGMGNEVGYAITAITETQAYFMTVPLSNEKYGDYIFQKVYTQDEFLKIYSPRSAKVYINEKEVTLSTAPILGDNFLEMDLFELLDALDVQYTYDKDHKTISCYDVTLQINGSYSVDIFKNGELVSENGNVRYVKGKYIGDMLLCVELGSTLGYDMEFHYDDYSVWIVKS